MVAPHNLTVLLSIAPGGPSYTGFASSVGSAATSGEQGLRVEIKTHENTIVP